MSIDSNRFPYDWKTARVIPLFKNGQRSVLDNYRPIFKARIMYKTVNKVAHVVDCVICFKTSTKLMIII